MTREEMRLVASVLANSPECRQWIYEVAAASEAHTNALDWAIDNTPASTPERRALVSFATQFCGGFHARVPSNVLDRLETVVSHYQESGYDPTSELVTKAESDGVAKGEDPQ